MSVAFPLNFVCSWNYVDSSVPERRGKNQLLCGLLYEELFHTAFPQTPSSKYDKHLWNAVIQRGLTTWRSPSKGFIHMFTYQHSHYHCRRKALIFFWFTDGKMVLACTWFHIYTWSWVFNSSRLKASWTNNQHVLEPSTTMNQPPQRSQMTSEEVIVVLPRFTAKLGSECRSFLQDFFPSQIYPLSVGRPC